MLAKNICRKKLAVLGGIRQLQQVIDVLQLDAELGGEALVGQRSAGTGIRTCRSEGCRRKRCGCDGGQHGGGRRSSGQGSRGAGGRPRGGGRGHRFRCGGRGCSGGQGGRGAGGRPWGGGRGHRFHRGGRGCGRGRGNHRSGSGGDAREGIGQGAGGAGHQRPRSTAKEGIDDGHGNKSITLKVYMAATSHVRSPVRLGAIPAVCPLQV